jgi:hypothetical protein
MSTNPSRPARSLTPEHQARIAKAREQIAGELPDLIARERRMREAAQENTFSGELRCAIHTGERDLIALAQIVGITPVQLSEFLTGERTLRSDVLDRLVAAVGAHLSAPTTK